MAIGFYDEISFGKGYQNRAVLIPSETVYVFTDSATQTTADNLSAPLQPIFTDDTMSVSKANPFVADALGNINFWADASWAWIKVGAYPARRVRISQVGPKGDKGDKGDPGDITPSQNVVWTVGQAFGQDVRRYGSLGTDASVNTATLNAASAAHAQWHELLIPISPGQDLPINGTWELPEISGKKIRTLGTRNSTASPSLGGRIVQMANGIPIVHLKNVQFTRALEIELGLAYNTQQTTSDAIGFKITPIANGVPHDIKANLSIEKAYDGFKFVPSSGAYALWNLDLKARIWHSYHTSVDIVSIGAPSNTYDLFIANTNGGPTPTGPAVKLWNGEALFNRLDIEGWTNIALELFTTKTIVNNIHIEHHLFSGNNPKIIYNVSSPLHLVGGSIAMHQTTPGSIAAGYATIVYLESAKSKLWADDIDLIFPSALSGNVVFLDGASGVEDSYVGKGVINVGTKTVDVPVAPIGGYSFYDAPTKYRPPYVTSQWITATIQSGWSAIAGYQPPRYRKVGDKIEVEGAVQNTSGADNATPAIILPVGYRTNLAQLFPGYGVSYASPVVLNSGAIQPPSPVPASGVFIVACSYSVAV